MRLSWLAACLPFALVCCAAPVAAEEPADGAQGAVFVRAIGDFRAEYKHMWKPPLERRDVEIATGSGFVIAPGGLVLTNHHVIESRNVFAPVDGEPAAISLTVTRIEAVVGAGEARRVLRAAVVASDPELDLALLSVTAGDLPYLPFGDSDAAEAGQEARVLGFPYGRRVDVARPPGSAAAPNVTVSGGSVGAMREDEAGEPAYLQTDASVHPGSSGGPMLDKDGYVIGVVRSKLREGEGAAFAIPVNRVKDFLEANGFLQQLPAKRLRSLPPQSFDWKGLLLGVPDGMSDVSPSRLRLEAGDLAEYGLLTVDRVAGRLSLAQLQEALLAGELDGVPLQPRGAPQLAAGLGRSRQLLGSALAVREGRELRVEYALHDLGNEKVVARFTAPPPQVAFNLAVVRAALLGLEAERLITAPLAAPLREALQPARLQHPRAPAVELPAGFVIDETADPTCPALGAPDSLVSASPPGDFTVAFRVSFWAGSVEPPAEAGCPQAFDYQRLGAHYRSIAANVRHEDGLLRFQVDAPREKWGFVDALARAWLQKAAGKP